MAVRPAPPRIEALSRLDDIEEVAEAFERERGYEPEMLSHWDPKPDVQVLVEGWVAVEDVDVSSVPYAYSGYLDLEDRALLEALREDPGRKLLATPSGTASIATVAAFLQALGVQTLGIVTPTYFAIEALCASLGIGARFIPIRRHGRGYRLPAVAGLADVEAVWLTMPVFGASCYLEAEVAAWIDALPAGVVVVVDESLAFPERTCLAGVASLGRVVRIVTPNKAICVNGEKVSLVSSPPAWHDALNDLSECYCGGIGASGMRALRFLRSAAFGRATAACRALVAIRRRALEGVLADLPGCETDADADGHFAMLHWPRLPMACLSDRSFATQAMTQSGACVIPASRNRHDEADGLCFRVNLFRLDDAGLGSLRRLALFLDSAARPPSGPVRP